MLIFFPLSLKMSGLVMDLILKVDSGGCIILIENLRILVSLNVQTGYVLSLSHFCFFDTFLIGDNSISFARIGKGSALFCGKYFGRAVVIFQFRFSYYFVKFLY